MYSPKLLEYFQDSRCSGELPGADVTVRLENPACGDLLILALRVSDEMITAARFQVKGCVAAIACAAALAEMLQGKTLDAAAAIAREEVVLAVGGLPEGSLHASHLAYDALRTALKQIANPRPSSGRLN